MNVDLVVGIGWATAWFHPNTYYEHCINASKFYIRYFCAAVILFSMAMIIMNHISNANTLKVEGGPDDILI